MRVKNHGAGNKKLRPLRVKVDGPDNLIPYFDKLQDDERDILVYYLKADGMHNAHVGLLPFVSRVRAIRAVERHARFTYTDTVTKLLHRLKAPTVPDGYHRMNFIFDVDCRNPAVEKYIEKYLDLIKDDTESIKKLFLGSPQR